MIRVTRDDIVFGGHPDKLEDAKHDLMIHELLWLAMQLDADQENSGISTGDHDDQVTAA